MSFNTNQKLLLLKSSRFCPGMLLSFWGELLVTAPEKMYHTPDSYSTVIQFLLLFIKVYLYRSKTQSIGWILDENVSSSWLRCIPPSKINIKWPIWHHNWLQKRKQTRMSFIKNILLFFFSFAAKKQKNREKSRKVDQS